MYDLSFFPAEPQGAYRRVFRIEIKKQDLTQKQDDMLKTLMRYAGQIQETGYDLGVTIPLSLVKDTGCNLMELNEYVVFIQTNGVDCIFTEVRFPW